MPMASSSNHYEQVFENWLIDNRIGYVPVDQAKRAVFARSKIKSFDFLIYPRDGRSEIILAEVKGRKFSGASLKNLTGLQCWVTADDISGLARWEKVFGQGYVGAFVFAYQFEKIDVELDGRQVYDFGGRRYLFLSVRLEDYRTFMTLRSPKWQTLSLPAENFRASAVEIGTLLR